jgi:hypothetical protein
LQRELYFFFRTTVIIFILTLILSIVYKLKLKPDAYFNTVNFGTLFLGNFIYGLQLISFCIANAQLFDANVRAVVFTFIIYFIFGNLYSVTMLWPPGIQYVLMFFFPYIAGRSLFQVNKYL